MKQKLFVISRRCGRLANRLVLFANVIALAEELGARVANPTFLTYADLFETTRRDTYCRYPVVEGGSIWDRLPGTAKLIRAIRLPYRVAQFACVFSERISGLSRRTLTLREIPRVTTLLESDEVQARLAGADRVFIHGWRFRAPSWVQKHAVALRNYFRPVPELLRQAGSAVEPLRSRAGVVVGVHVRHGDYRTWKQGRFFYPTEAYAGWMGSLNSQLAGRKAAFLVCSDEPRTRGEFPGLEVGFGANSAVADLYALTQCDYIIGPPSTFTQWASFYGNRPLLHVESREGGVALEQFKVSDLRRIP